MFVVIQPSTDKSSRTFPVTSTKRDRSACRKYKPRVSRHTAREFASDDPPPHVPASTRADTTGHSAVLTTGVSNDTVTLTPSDAFITRLPPSLCGAGNTGATAPTGVREGVGEGVDEGNAYLFQDLPCQYDRLLHVLPQHRPVDAHFV